MPNGFFEQNFQKNAQNRIKEHHHRILHIRRSLGTKFQLKLTISFFDQTCPKKVVPVQN